VLARAAFLLLSYSLGLGVPFVLVGLGVERLGALAAVRRHHGAITGVAGGAMLAIGLLVASGAWTRLLAPLLRAIGRFTPAL
jgi:cytochrome c-type biogenesis protein